MRHRLGLAIAVIAGLLLGGCAPAALTAAVATNAPAVLTPAAATNTRAVTVQASPTEQLPPTATAVPATIPPSPAVETPTNVTASPSPSPTHALPTRAPHPPPPTVGPAHTPPPAPTAGPDTGTAFRAWGVAPDGRFYLLESSGVVRRSSPDLVPLDASGPLFDGRDPGRSHMAIREKLLILSSEALTRTLVLETESFARVREIPKGGPVALDGSRRLFVLAEDAVWAYDLADASAQPVPVTKWPVDPFTPRPRNLAIDAGGNQLLVTLHDVSASPPHQQEWYAAYDLASLQPLHSYPAQPGQLTQASVGSGRIVAGMAAKNGFLGSKVAVFDSAGQEVRHAQPLDGQPVVDPAGEWIYVARDRGIWVLRASDLSLVAMSPSFSGPPIDMLVSPDGQKLYSIFDGSIATQETAALRAAGIAPLAGPLLPSWFAPGQSDFFRARFYPAPGTPDTAFVEVGGYGETWATGDQGATWRLLQGFGYPSFHYVNLLSISPDFQQDHTMVGVASSSPMYLRSIDGGDTWSAWNPPVAFVSQRDGNREIYTAERGQLGGDPGFGAIRRTGDPAGDENPAWSPGWTRIAFQSNRGGDWDIYTVRADCDPSRSDAESACDLRRLTDDPADDMLPAWSPDGKWIAFVSTRAGKADIYLVPSNGGAATRLTNSANGAWRPAWLPDSQRLLYTATTPDGSNDIVMTTLVESSNGTFSQGETTSVIATAADERDPAVWPGLFVYLSNEAGYPRTYGRYFYDQASSFPFSVGTEAEGHPSVLGDGANTVLVTLVRNGQTGIYRTTATGYEPWMVNESYNGQPVAGPVPWRPGAEWSQERYRLWQK